MINPRQLSGASLGVFLAIFLGACGASSLPEPPSDPNVLALFEGGQLTTEDLDGYVLRLPAEKRVLGDRERTPWYLELLEEMAIDRWLAGEAESQGLADTPAIAARLAESDRHLALQAFIQRQAGAIEPISEQDLRDRFEAATDRFRLPETRRAFNLFLRREPGQSSEDLRAKMATLRARLEAGESFRQLASDHSDSESRHRGGDLGVLRQGKLPAQLERIIFSLPLNVPSAPIVTAEGVHLFMVDQSQSARVFTFEEVATLLEREIFVERRSQLLRELASDLPPASEGVKQLGEDDIQAALEAGDRSVTVLEAGPFTETLENLLQRFDSSSQANPSPASLAALLEQLEMRERIYTLATSESWFDEPDLAKRRQQVRENLLIAEERQRALEAMLDKQPDALRSYYENNALRFSTPLEMKLRILRVPLGSGHDSNATMARLESLKDEPATSFESVATDLGGSVTELGWLPFPAFSRILPPAAPLAADLSQGQSSAPFRANQHLVVLHMLDRREPAPRPFSTVIDEVRQAYLEARGQELYRQWQEDRLEEIGWRVLLDRVEALTPVSADANSSSEGA